MRLNFVERILNFLFRNLGFLVATHPWKCIVFSLLLCLGLSTGLLYGQYRIKTHDLLVPHNARSVLESEEIDRIFKTNVSANFDFGRSTHIKRFARVIFKPKNGSNILRSRYVDTIFEIHKLIENITVTYNGKQIAYSDICARKNGKCYENDILFILPHLKDFEDGVYAIKYPLMYDSRTARVFFMPLTLGGVETFNGDFVSSARGLSLMYVLDFSKTEDDERNNAWEEEFLATLSELDLEDIEVTFFTSESIIKEAERNVIKIVPYVVAVGIVLIVFSGITGSGVDCARSKPLLGVFGLIVGLLGVSAAFGLCLYLGVTCFAFNIGVVLIMLGISMDDTFVMMAAWRCTDVRKSVQERLSETYETAGVAITLTSVTNAITFLIGALTPLYFSYTFCMYSMVSVIFCYFYCVTFYGAVMAIFGRLEEQGRHSLFFCFTVPDPAAPDDGRTRLSRHCWSRTLEQDSSDTSSSQQAPNMYMVFFRDVFARYVFSTPGKVVICVLYILYLASSFYGITHFQLGIREKDMADDYSYVKFYWDDYYALFKEYAARGQIVLPDPMDYSDPKVQASIEHVIKTLESSPDIANSTLTESWLRQYLLFLNSGKFYLWYRGYDLSKKDSFIRSLREVFLQIPGFSRFRDDIVFNENGTEIIASRFILQISSLPDANYGINLVRWLRSFLDSQPFRVYVYNPLTPLVDHVIILEYLTIQSVLIATVVMMIVAFLFIPKLEAVFLMTFTIISIQIGMIGFMGIADIWLNTVTMVVLIVSVGFSIDSTAHIVCAFNESKMSNPMDRMADSLYYIGFPITQGFLTTIIGASAFAFSTTEIKLSLFKMVALVMVFSYFHGLFVLPFIILMKEKFCKSGRKQQQEDASSYKLSAYKNRLLKYFVVNSSSPDTCQT